MEFAKQPEYINYENNLLKRNI